MASADDEYRAILQNMIDTRVKHIHGLLDLHTRGVEVGTPKLEDIIDREQAAIDGLKLALDNFSLMVASRGT